jgi:hypothetical protein
MKGHAALGSLGIAKLSSLNALISPKTALAKKNNNLKALRNVRVVRKMNDMTHNILTPLDV